jgi:hypothetical protein
MHYAYGRLNEVDDILNRITVGDTRMRISQNTARTIKEQKLVGKYVKVRCSLGRYINRANELEEVEYAE